MLQQGVLGFVGVFKVLSRFLGFGGLFDFLVGDVFFSLRFEKVVRPC